MEPPETGYAHSGDVSIGYQAVGRGELDLVLLDTWFGNVDAVWLLPPFARFVERLTSFARVLLLASAGPGSPTPCPSAVCRRSRSGWTTSGP